MSSPTLTIPAKAGIALTPAEVELLSAFRSLSQRGREVATSMMQVCTRHYPGQRPALTLVSDAGQSRGDRNAQG